MRKAGWAIAAVVVVVIVLVVVQVTRSTPAQTVVTHTPSPVHVTGTSSLPWPTNGAAAVAVGPTGAVRTSGAAQEKPIASLAKMMTAYVVLTDHPLQSGQPGPSITITTADVATYNSDVAASDSVLPVSAGEAITEQQALEGLLVASADNIAVVLAEWDAGSLTAFVGKMNAAAKALGMDHTHYTDPSGLQTTTVSTPSDQLAIARKAMADPTFASIVALQSGHIPVGGTVQNYDYDVGHDGIIGIKTGSDSAAGGCWAFAATRTVAGQAADRLRRGARHPGHGHRADRAGAGRREGPGRRPARHREHHDGAARPHRRRLRDGAVALEPGPDHHAPTPPGAGGQRVDRHLPRLVGPGGGHDGGRRAQPLGSVTAEGVGGVALSPVEAAAAGSGPTVGWRLTRL